MSKIEEITNRNKVIHKTKINSGKWELIKQNAKEYHLRCNKDCIQQIQVGEIVGLRQIQNKYDDVCIAIISWLKTHGENGITFGAKPISPSAIPIEITMLVNKSKKHSGQHALLLPEINKSGQHSSILSYPHPYRSGSLVSVTIHKSNIPIRLTNKIENSGLYNRFQFERFVDKKEPQKKIKPSKTTKPHKKNNDVWTSF